MRRATVGVLVMMCFIVGFLDLAGGTETRLMPEKRVIKRKKHTKSTPADLKVVSIRITPDPPRARKDLLTIKVTVKNVGGAPTPIPASLTMSVYSVDANGNRIAGKDINMNAIPWYTNNIPVLNPNQTKEISKTITCNHPGPHEVSGVIITEGFSAGDERSHNNNYEKIFQVHLPPQYADLELTRFHIDSAGRLVIKMCNKGAAIPYRDFEYSQVRVYVDNDPYKSLHFPEVDPAGILRKGRIPLPTGPIKYLVFKWPTTGHKGLQFTSGQTYTVKVVLNYNNSIYDKKLNNNRKTKNITAP